MTDDGRRALTNRGGPTSSRGDPRFAAVAVRAFERAGFEEPDALTHGFHAWPARMHRAIPATLLDAWGRGGPQPAAGAVVLDPFMGSGTVLVEARARGLRAAGVDLNPLARLLVDVKTRTPDDDEIARFTAAATRVVEANRARVKARAASRAPLPPAEARWYDGHVLRELAGLFEEIEAEPDMRLRRALVVVFTAIVVKFSKQQADTSAKEAQKRIGRFVPTEFYGKKAAELADRWRSLRAAAPPPSPDPLVVEGDALALREALPPGFRADVVITSPPYGGTYDYAAHHARRLAWLGVDARAFERGEIGARRRSDDDDARARWEAQTAAMLESIAAVVVPGGLVALVVGDAEVKDARVPADRQLADLASDRGWEPLAVASQPRRDWRGKGERDEHLAILRAPPAPRR